MFLAQLSVSGFRGIDQLHVDFRPGLNILVGPNNVGKTTILDALRALLGASDESSLRLDELDLHVDRHGERAVAIEFRYVFQQLSPEEEADFLPALVPATDARYGPFEAHFAVRYMPSDVDGRMRPRKWSGRHDESTTPPELLERLRAVYLPPLRDPSSGLRPGRFSQLAKLIRRLSSTAMQQELADLLEGFDQQLALEGPISNTQSAISTRHGEMLGELLAQKLAVGLVATNFSKLAARLSMTVNDMDVEQNGLGYNNLIFMAVVLSELSLDDKVPYKALIIEEPEAHLHPQLQAVLLHHLQTQDIDAKKVAQIFVTSHSPNFASLASLDSLICVHRDDDTSIRPFLPRSATFGRTKKKKLQRYLDVTKAELFFARRIVLGEGSAELFMLNVLAKKLNINLRHHSVSVLSTEGLNFDAFVPLFGENALHIPLAILTDADPPSLSYPRLDSSPQLSANAKVLSNRQDRYRRVFFSRKTFEYDLALHPENHEVMLHALKLLHPVLARELRAEVRSAPPEDRPRMLFCGMFQRDGLKKQVKKGEYGQALAQAVNDAHSFVVPPYIREAIAFVTAPP